MNRGSYTINHLSDTYPIGRMYSVKVYDPNGTYIGGNTGVYNGFVSLNMRVTMSGVYHWTITPILVNDTQSVMKLAYSLNYNFDY